MTFLVIERFRGGDALPVYRRFQSQGRHMPETLRYVASWVTADFSTCYQIMECDETQALETWIDRWRDLVDFEVVPVITSTEAFEILKPRL